MGALSPLHWLLIIAVAILLFGGRGKISGVMGDFAKGIKAFKAGMKDEDEPDVTQPHVQVTSPPPAAATTAAESKREHV
ncbi:MAG: twin-arginine translocase TatA/TatE family subunit [Stellaceae bacterium]